MPTKPKPPQVQVRIVTITPMSGRVVLWRGTNNRNAVKRFNQYASRYAARGLRVWAERVED